MTFVARIQNYSVHFRTDSGLRLGGLRIMLRSARFAANGSSTHDQIRERQSEYLASAGM
jgi:hypothetical protein